MVVFKQNSIYVVDVDPSQNPTPDDPTALVASFSIKLVGRNVVGFLAVVLAMVGLYGVISYMVARRRGEIGIRIALGASRGDVLGLVLREAVVLLAFGLAIGTGLAIAAARTASSLLFGLKPTDPLTIGLSIAFLAAVAVVASLFRQCARRGWNRCWRCARNDLSV